MSAPRPVRDFGLIQRVREEDEELQKPLEWGLVRRLFGYTAPIKGKVMILAILTVIRSAQLPALGWIMALVINGPISGRDVPGLTLGIVAYGVMALAADGLFHFRQRFALEIGETVVNRLRAEIFEKMQKQPMSFFHRVKIGRIIGRVTSDVESVRTGIQDVMFVSLVQAGTITYDEARNYAVDLSEFERLMRG